MDNAEVYVIRVTDPHHGMSYVQVFASAKGANAKASEQVNEWRKDAEELDHTIEEATPGTWDSVLEELRHESVLDDEAAIEITSTLVQP